MWSRSRRPAIGFGSSGLGTTKNPVFFRGRSTYSYTSDRIEVVVSTGRGTPNLPWIKAQQPLGRRPTVTDIAIPIRTIDQGGRVSASWSQADIYDTKYYDAQLSSRFWFI